MDKTFLPSYSSSQITYAKVVDFSHFRLYRKKSLLLPPSASTPPDVTKQPTVALKAVNVFSIVLDKSIDMNNNPLVVVARYCSGGDVHEELCCLKPMYGTTKGKDIRDIFTKNFEERGIDIKKIFQLQQLAHLL